MKRVQIPKDNVIVRIGGERFSEDELKERINFFFCGKKLHRVNKVISEAKNTLLWFTLFTNDGEFVVKYNYYLGAKKQNEYQNMIRSYNGNNIPRVYENVSDFLKDKNKYIQNQNRLLEKYREDLKKKEKDIKEVKETIKSIEDGIAIDYPEELI